MSVRSALPLLFLLSCTHEPFEPELPADPVECGLGAADGYVDGELAVMGGEWSPEKIVAVWRARAADNPSGLELQPDFTAYGFRDLYLGNRPPPPGPQKVTFQFHDHPLNGYPSDGYSASEVTFIVDNSGTNGSCIAGRFRAVFDNTKVKGVVAGWFKNQ